MSSSADDPPATPSDDKDWTWVLAARCPECGFDARSVPRDRLGDLIRETGRRWEQVLAGPGIARRPAPEVWSPLEYGCHCRDVYLVFGERVALLLAADDPLFANWDQDATATEKRYWEADPALVSVELGRAAGTAASAFDGVRDDQWARTGRRSNGSTFTVESLGRYFAHDVVHHLHDVGAPGERAD